MAKFCKYCGTPLGEGQVCGCAGAQAERAQKAAYATGTPANNQGAAYGAGPMNNQGTVNGTATSAAYGTYTAGAAGQTVNAAAGIQNMAENPSAQKAKNIFMDTVNIFKSYLLTPVKAMEDALSSTDKIPQFLVAAVFAVLMLIAVSAVCGGKSMKYVLSAAGIGTFRIFFTFTLLFIGTRAAYSCVAGLFAKKQNETLDMVSCLGLFSTTFVVDIIMLILTGICSIVFPVEILTALVITWMISTAVTSSMATWVVFGEKMEPTYRLTLVMQLVLWILLIFIMKGIGARMLETAISSFSSQLLDSLF
jgi:hypothetical protein